MIKLRALGFSLAIAAAAAPVSAYEIKAKHSVHEAITRLALRCAQAGEPGTPPADCKQDYRQIAVIAAYPRSLLTNFNRLEASVRWPDDPLRSLYSPGGAIGFGVKTALGGCEHGDAERGLETLYGRGLLCGSHYGRLQFLHAMAVDNEQDQAEITRRKVLDWAMFAYQVATARAPAGAPYCRYVGENAGAVALELSPKGFPFCGPTERPSWRVGTLFSLKCWLPTTRAGCTEYLSETRAQRAAAGAFLHVIQDSYSQSHTRRSPGASTSDFVPRADCGFPSEFYAYTEVNRAHHSDADKAPARGDACGSPAAAADVVTASAEAIWHLCRNSDPGVVRAFLEQRVFGKVGEEAEQAASPEVHAGRPAPFPKQCGLIP